MTSTGEKLNKALEWLERGISLEAKGDSSKPMVQKCIDKAVALEAEGIAAGEKWD